MEHWMAFGSFSTKTFFSHPFPNTYQGTVIGGNMAAYAPAGIASFLLARHPHLPYVIDPLTHAFQHPPSSIKESSGKTKRSIDQLADELGGVIRENAGLRPLAATMFAHPREARELTRRCLDFQRAFIPSKMRALPEMEFLEVLTDDEICPKAYIPPYFYMTEGSLQTWAPINRACVDVARELIDPATIMAMVVIDRGVISSEELIDAAVASVKSDDIGGYFIWIDEFSEHEASALELRGLISLGARLRSNPQQLILNTHASYFSTLVAGLHEGTSLNGVMHGPEYGEDRAVIPVGGGIPISKYYLPALHLRLRFQDALAVLLAKGWLDSVPAFLEHVCDCPTCTRTIQQLPADFDKFGEATTKTVQRMHGPVRMQYPTGAAKKLCTEHYLWRKTRECEFVDQAARAVVLVDLQASADGLADVIGDEGVDHLRVWHAVPAR
jgi:hypothetical protein